MSVSVADNPDQRRYEISVEGDLAGASYYEIKGDEIAFMHTEVDPRHKGEGLGSRLVGGALDDVRGRGLSVLPYCPFVRSYIAEHDEYVDLVPDDRREEFGLVSTAPE